MLSKNALVIFIAASLFPLLGQAQLPDPLPIEDGYIQGTLSEVNGVNVYRGIPYASPPPTGANRWRDPQAVSAWSGVRSATEFGPRCVQRGFAPGEGQNLISEDCLYLNVHTIAESIRDDLPVMVFVHGGGYFGGAGSDTAYDGSRLAEKGAIVVTINYRLGSFGFFAHPELSTESSRKSSGNYALMDMIAALQWIQNNIQNFGGDPDNVTVFGESAGAQSVSALIASPLTEGLFRRAIVQSAGWFGWMGTGMPAYPTLAEAEAEGLSTMESFGASNLDDLRAASTQDIFENFPAGGQIIVDGRFLPEDPSVIFNNQEQQRVDLLAGSNANESVFFGPGPSTASDFIDNINAAYGDLADEFFELYPAGNDASAGASYNNSFNNQVAWHMRQMARMQESAGSNAYVYFFTHVPPGGEARGATHTTEMDYVLNLSGQNASWTETDLALAEIMSSYWVNFAASGNPNGSGLPTWPVYTEHRAGKVQVLGDKVTTETELMPALENIYFFDNAFRNAVNEQND